jgi:hypothetical protein
MWGRAVASEECIHVKASQQSEQCARFAVDPRSLKIDLFHVEHISC